MRVLVIEDDVEMAEAIGVGLRRARMAVDVAHDGIGGLDRALDADSCDRPRPRPTRNSRGHDLRRADPGRQSQPGDHAHRRGHDSRTASTGSVWVQTTI